MLRKLICTSVALVLFASVVAADEIRAAITKVDQKKNITFTEYKKDGKRTLPAENAKVYWLKLNWQSKKMEAGEEIPHGLRNKMFTDIDSTGITALLITTDSKSKEVTKICVFDPSKKLKP